MQPVLIPTDLGLSLKTSSGQLLLDFVGDRHNYHRPLKKGKNELIAKALGINKGLRQVLDLTAGLGQDAVVFARLGCQVTAVERSPWIYPLLEDAHRRGLPHLPWLNNIKFVFADSIQFLRQLPENQFPDVIYIDPMFPESKKTALPRKEMQIFREVIGADSDSTDLLHLSLSKSLDRVVVKRGLRSPELSSGVSHHFEGSSVRYDLYLAKKNKGESQ